MCVASTPVLEYRPMNDDDMTWLYALLIERLKRPEINISHRKMPSRANHRKFWESGPYKIVEVIIANGWLAGYWYLSKQNEIGIRLHQKYDSAEVNGRVLDHILFSVPRKELLANVNPANTILADALMARGFSVCQHTYRLTR